MGNTLCMVRAHVFCKSPCHWRRHYLDSLLPQACYILLQKRFLKRLRCKLLVRREEESGTKTGEEGVVGNLYVISSFLLPSPSTHLPSSLLPSLFFFLPSLSRHSFLPPPFTLLLPPFTLTSFLPPSSLHSHILPSSLLPPFTLTSFLPPSFLPSLFSLFLLSPLPPPLQVSGKTTQWESQVTAISLVPCTWDWHPSIL